MEFKSLSSMIRVLMIAFFISTFLVSVGNSQTKKKEENDSKKRMKIKESKLYKEYMKSEVEFFKKFVNVEEDKDLPRDVKLYGGTLRLKEYFKRTRKHDREFMLEFYCKKNKKGRKFPYDCSLVKLDNLRK